MSQLKLEILLDMANKVSAPLKAMQTDTKGLSSVLREARGELRQIENSQRLADKIRKDQLALRDLAQARYLYLISRIRLLALSGAGAREGIEETNAWLGG